MSAIPMLDQAWLRDACSERGLPWRVRVLPETPSTNDLLRDEGRQRDVTGEVVFAERQTAGRGRRENIWQGEAGHDLLFSLAWRPTVAMAKWTRATQMIALAVCRAVERELEIRAEIKWPNDVLIAGKKSCGILVESFGGTNGSFLVAGVGLNVNAPVYAGALAETAVSLRMASGSPEIQQHGVDRTKLALVLLEELASTMEAVGNDQLFESSLAQVRERNAWLGRQVRLIVDGDECWGKVTGLTDEGALQLLTPEGRELVIHSAEQVRLV